MPRTAINLARYLEVRRDFHITAHLLPLLNIGLHLEIIGCRFTKDASCATNFERLGKITAFALPLFVDPGF